MSSCSPSRWTVLMSASFHTQDVCCVCLQVVCDPCGRSGISPTSNTDRAGVSSDSKMSGSAGLIILHDLTSTKAFKSDKSC